MLTLLLLALAQPARCDAAMLEARAHLMRFEAARAETVLIASAREGCGMDLALTYLRGLVAARAAYATGGDQASLAPVQAAIAAVGERAALGDVAEIAGFVLRAAVAAAQSERDEMAVMLAQALQVERSRGARGLGGAPLVSAHEVAGELWLQVHRYDEAAAAFRVARAYSGDTPRITIGLARSLARQTEAGAACDEYRRLASQARAIRPSMPDELAEARKYLQEPACRTPARR
jgi:hypothetical protein